jgi:hypothetical protein
MADSSMNRREWIAGATLGMTQLAHGAESGIPRLSLGRTGEEVWAWGIAYRKAQGRRGGSDPADSIRARPGVEFPGQLVGLQRRAKRDPRGQGVARWRRYGSVCGCKEGGQDPLIGFTGHKDPHVHLYMLETADEHGFHFDTVQMPLNVMDVHFRSFEKLVLPEAVKRNIAVLGMKSMGSGVILKSNTVSAEECLRYAMNLPVAVVITGIDSQAILDQAIRTAKSFKPLTRDQVSAITSKTAN